VYKHDGAACEAIYCGLAAGVSAMMVVAVELYWCGMWHCSYCHQQKEIVANVIVLLPCANGADWLYMSKDLQMQ
jgi:hypothetical protein